MLNTLREFAWSYSKLKNFETCPKRHYEVDIAKNFSEKDGEALLWGNQVHDSLAKACKGEAPLPDIMKPYQKWVDAVLAGPGELHVEEKYAITRNFEPRKFFSDPRRDVWYRGIADVVRIWELNGKAIALAMDWKTGKILEDSVQLMLMAQCIFAFYPQVQAVRTEFIWLAQDCTTPEVFTRQSVADTWVGLYERLHALEHAHTTQTYMPRPGKLCRSWCPVTSCPHHGKGYR